MSTLIIPISRRTPDSNVVRELLWHCARVVPVLETMYLMGPMLPSRDSTTCMSFTRLATHALT